MNPSTTIQRIKTLALTTLVAALVWMFAEGESLATRSVDVSIAFPVEASSDLVIRTDDPDFHGTARVRLEATARTLDGAAGSLGGRLNLAPGTPGVPTEPGDKVVDLREAIGAIRELKGQGSTVADVQPRTIRVKVVRMVKRDVPVMVQMPTGGDQMTLDGDPVVVPASITVRMPESMASAWPEGGSGGGSGGSASGSTGGTSGASGALLAVISESDLLGLKTDGPQTLNVTLKLPVAVQSLLGAGGGTGGGGLPVVLSSEQVAVTLRLRSRLQAGVLPSVPVWFSLPPTEDAGKWTVSVLDKFLSDVSVSGPADDVRRLLSGQSAPGGAMGGVKATVELSSDDLARASAPGPGGGPATGVLIKTVSFTGLPPGVTVSSPVAGVRVRVALKQ